MATRNKLEEAVHRQMKGMHWQLFTICRGCGCFAWCAGNRRDQVKCPECHGS